MPDDNADAPGSSRSMRIALHDLGLSHIYVIYPGDQAYPVGRKNHRPAAGAALTACRKTESRRFLNRRIDCFVTKFCIASVWNICILCIQSFLIGEAIKAYVEDQSWQIEAIKEGIKQADQRKFAPDSKVRNTFARYGVNIDED